MRIRRQYNNKRVTAKFNGRNCYFRSQFEYKWACYLQFLKDSKIIKDWFYEPDIFIFEGERTAPVQYRPDFKLIGTDSKELYQECKGYHDGQTNSKLRRMARHYPDVVMELVLMRIPKKGKVNRRRIAEKYVRRIIDASKIFRQIKGIVNLNIPHIRKG